nr:winged helix-turn-helix domain-containing protein [Aurantiacibacter rhizosphaerae]
MAGGGGTQCSTYQLGAFQIDPSRNLIRDEDRFFRIEPRVMDVLCSLAQRQGEVVTRRQLIDMHWGSQFSGDESLTRAISRLRKTFKSAGAKEPYIETIPKRGYRLRQVVLGFEDQCGAVDDEPEEEVAAEAPDRTKDASMPPGYSVAVVPLRVSEGTAEAALAEEIGCDLVQMLSRAPNLRVAAYQGWCAENMGALGADELGRRLNVHYLVSGSVRRFAEKQTLRIELIDTISNRHIMSWKFEETAANFLSNLDDFILDLSTPIVCEIQIAEASLAHMREPDEMDARAAVRSTEILRQAYSSQRAAEIVAHLEDLITRDPDNGVVHASLAAQLTQNVVSGWSKTPPADFARAELHIKRALKIAPRDPDVLASAGIFAFMKRDDEAAVQFLERSLKANPNNPHALAVLGFQRGITIDHQAGIEMICTAEKRAIHHPRSSVWAMYRGCCHLAAQELDSARQALREAIDRNPNYHLPYVLLATALILEGRLAEARDMILGGREVNPEYTSCDWAGLLETFPELYRKYLKKSDLVKQICNVWINDMIVCQ